MALPVTRNTTYAPNDPVLSADLNDIQDQIIALAAGRRVSYKKILSLTNWVEIGGTSDVTIQGGRLTVSTPGGTRAVDGGLEFEVGDRLDEIRCFLRSKSAAGNFTMTLYRAARADSVLSQVTIGTVTITAVGEAALTGLAEVIAEDVRYYLTLDFPNENAEVSYIEAVIDQP